MTPNDKKIFLVKEPSDEEKGTVENGDWGTLIFGNIIREYGIELTSEEFELLKDLLDNDLRIYKRVGEPESSSLVKDVKALLTKLSKVSE